MSTCLGLPCPTGPLQGLVTVAPSSSSPCSHTNALASPNRPGAFLSPGVCCTAPQRGTRVLTPQAQAHVRAHAGKAFTLRISTPREPVPIFQGRVQGFTPPGSLPSHSRLRSLLWAPIAPLLPCVPARLTLAHLPAPSDCEPLKGWPGLLDLGASVPGRGVSGKIS